MRWELFKDSGDLLEAYFYSSVIFEKKAIWAKILNWLVSLLHSYLPYPRHIERDVATLRRVSRSLFNIFVCE